ncbi:MAG TPA: N-6 DNA methylase [Chitinophagales bacterium]|nr:N-6 DNA methylase [Chitinophagales bacterium]
MSLQQIHHYHNQIHQARRLGAITEGTLSPYFYNLVTNYAMAKKYLFLREITIKSKKTSSNIRPDGILMNELRIHRGYWESKDSQDDLDVEIQKKIHEKGYPTSNILFEDTQTAVLIQGGEEVLRVDMNNAVQLHQIITAFINYQPAEVQEFEQALLAFRQDIPQIAQAFRDLFEEQGKSNPRYIEARNHFWELCKEEINPDISELDINEMLIQHILTEDLFTAIFDDADFLRHNIIAQELEGVINTVLTRDVRKNKLGDIKHYYQTLNATAASIADHHEKQKFLKTVYENFYKVYNPKGADRLGVVYTPSEIVRFMVVSTDYLLEKHFHKNLHDKGVEILDPATGTGTFVTDIIDYIAPQYLPYKYQNEIHANEVAILPYYIANLNIEYTYHQKMGKYLEFSNICFVDTLDNTAALAYQGKQHAIFGFNSENTERIKRQNDRKISVIIGNPPYNANQQNFNDFNKNREYANVDKRIKDTFVKYSAAQKTKVYDMYARFFRWSMDRVAANGIVAFVTNRSFVDSRTFDGFRKCVQDEFDYCYIVDLNGDIRTADKARHGNVFGIMTGVAIVFLVKTDQARDLTGIVADKKKCQLLYASLFKEGAAVEKLSYLQTTHFTEVPFERVQPDSRHNWINLGNQTSWQSFLPLMNKPTKNNTQTQQTIFKTYSFGVSTNRDEWVFDKDKTNLLAKAQFLTNEYNRSVQDQKMYLTMKWSRDLENKLKRNVVAQYNPHNIAIVHYRPFSKIHFYAEKMFSDVLTKNHYSFFGSDFSQENVLMTIINHTQLTDFNVFCSSILTDAGFSGRATPIVPMYYYDKNNERQDNITDWALEQFVQHYPNSRLTKEAIFHYVYAVLHHPVYRQKYANNLKLGFPRVPLYDNFEQWVAWGKALMSLHLGYENIRPYPLQRNDIELPNTLNKARLKADKEQGVIEIDMFTQLSRVPPLAWQYTLGNRSAIEWMLDQYKEKIPADKTIAEKFNPYRLADYKEQAIDLLQRICTLSVETMTIIGQMPVDM